MERLIQHVALTDARFFAYHGYYPEEQVLGNEFLVSIHTEFSPIKVSDTNLEGMLNYEGLYDIAKRTMMGVPEKILETLAERIFRDVQHHFPFVERITVTICKSHPPFGGDRAKATVTLSWEQ